MSARITKQLLKAAAPIDVPAKKAHRGEGKVKASTTKKKKSQMKHFLEEAKAKRLNADNTEKNLEVLKRTPSKKVQNAMQKILEAKLKK